MWGKKNEGIREGNATIQNNVIEQGPNTQNPYIIAYGEEGQSNPGTTVSIADNTIVNDDPGGARYPESYRNSARLYRQQRLRLDCMHSCPTDHWPSQVRRS